MNISADSLYLALSGATLDELVKPSLRAEWDSLKTQWFPRTDTPEHAAHDRRTTGNLSVIILHNINVYCFYIV